MFKYIETIFIYIEVIFKYIEPIFKLIELYFQKHTCVFPRSRLPKANVYYFNSPDHRGHHVLSFCVCFDVEEDVYQFSLTYPYSYSRLQAYLALLETRMLPFCRRTNLANTVVSGVGIVYLTLS